MRAGVYVYKKQRVTPVTLVKNARFTPPLFFLEAVMLTKVRLSLLYELHD